MPMSFSVKFFPKNVDITLDDKVTILEAAFRAGVEINSACGGKGTCGRCKVLVEGKTESEHSKLISDVEWQRGWRLACRTIVASDAAIFVPEESRLEDLQIYEGFSKAEVRSLGPVDQGPLPGAARSQPRQQPG